MTKSVQKSLLTFALAVISVGWSAVALAQDDPGESTASDRDAAAEAAESEEAAKEKEEEKDDLADRIKSVQRKVFLKKKRFELAPYVGLDLNDPLFLNFMVGGAATYHFVDSLALEVRGGGVVARADRNIIRIIRVEEGAVLENAPEFQYHADADLQWAPIYGKISLFGAAILHFDTYITVGGGVFGTDVGTNPSLNIGIGQRYFMNDWLAFRWEIRDYMFIEERNGSSDLQNLAMLGIGVSVFLPTSFQYEFQ